MSRPYAYAPDQIDRRLNEGWDAVRKAVARLLVLTGWTLGALPREGRMMRAVHRAACAVLRPAEKQARRIIIVLARRLPAPTLPAAKPVPAQTKSPQTVQITPRGPLHAVLNPEPARSGPSSRQSNRISPDRAQRRAQSRRHDAPADSLISRPAFSAAFAPVR